MFALGRFSPRRQPGLILAGAAAGVAAAFNTPLAGIVFGIEEMSRAFETRTSSLIIAAVIAAGLTSLALMGNYTYFGTTRLALRHGMDWLAIPALRRRRRPGGRPVQPHRHPDGARTCQIRSGRAIKRHPLGFALVCGLAVAICGIVSGDTIYGTGYSQVKAALESGTPLPVSFGFSSSWRRPSPRSAAFPAASSRRRWRSAPASAANIASLFHGAPLARDHAARHGVVFRRRRSGADHRLRHRDRDDRQPRHGRAADGGGDDRLCHVAAGLRGGHLSRARQRLYRESEPAAGGRRRASAGQAGSA